MAVRVVFHLGGKSAGTELKDGIYRIGRQAPADVVVADPTVSINHAELQVRGEDWLVRDLGSTNGTFLNDQQIRAATRVKSSDVLRCGSVTIGLERVAAAADPAAGPQTPYAGTVKVEAVKEAAREAAGKLRWNVRYWIAGAEAVIFLLILFFFIQIYTSSVESKEWSANRFRLFAEQYVHVLKEGVTTIPAPALDDSLADPIMVADRTGKILYPTGETAPKQSPLVNPKTNAVYQDAKGGLFVLPNTADASGTPAKSYPVRSGGELRGFVIARPTSDAGPDVTFVLLLLLFSGAIALIVLFFALRPVNARVIGELEALKSKISPLANGFIETLPRSATFEEANGIADEIEGAFHIIRASGGKRGATSGKGSAAGELVPLVADLFAATGIPYCIVDQDFKAVLIGPELKRVAELASTARGSSIFDAGLTSVQSKQLVQVIGDARRDKVAQARLQLTRNGSMEPHLVTVEMFEAPKTGAQLFGIAFTPGV
jgi:hypothetical protein